MKIILLLSVLVLVLTIFLTHIFTNKTTITENYNLLDLSDNELTRDEECKFPQFRDKCGNCINEYIATSNTMKSGFLGISNCCLNTNEHPIDSSLDCLHITDDCSGNKYLDKCGNCISKNLRQYEINNSIANKDGIVNGTQCCKNTGLGINGEEPDCNGICGGDDGKIPDGKCDCDGNTLDDDGVCGGTNLTSDPRCNGVNRPHIITKCGECINSIKRDLEITNNERSQNDTNIICNKFDESRNCIEYKDTQCCKNTGLSINREKPDCADICGGNSGELQNGTCDCSGNVLDADGICDGDNLSNDSRCDGISPPHLITKCGKCMNKINMTSLINSNLMNPDGTDSKTRCCINGRDNNDNLILRGINGEEPNNCGLCSNYGPNGYPLLEDGSESCNCDGGIINKCNECVSKKQRDFKIKDKIISENDTKLLCKKFNENNECIKYQDSLCCESTQLGVNGENPDCDGVCNNNPVPEGKCDCDGNTLDLCGVCGGDTNDVDPSLMTKIDASGNQIPKTSGEQCSCYKCYDLSGNRLDINDEIECISNRNEWKFDVIDECGICGGNNVIPEGKCDCSGNEIDECGVCGGGGVNPNTKCCDFTGIGPPPKNLPKNECGICEDKAIKDYPNQCCPKNSPLFPNLSIIGFGPDASGNCGGMTGLNDIIPTDIETAQKTADRLGLSLGNMLERYVVSENKYCQDMKLNQEINTFEDCQNDCSGNCGHFIYNEELGIGRRCYKQMGRCDVKTSSTGSNIYSLSPDINTETDTSGIDISVNDFTGDYYVKGFHSYKTGPNFGKAFFGLGGNQQEITGDILPPTTIKDAEEVALNLGLNLGGPYKEFLGYYPIKGLHAYNTGPNANCAFFGLAGTDDEMRADIIPNCKVRDQLNGDCAPQPYRPTNNIFRPYVQDACDINGNTLDDCGMCTYGSNRRMKSNDDEVNKTICCPNTNKTLAGTPCN